MEHSAGRVAEGQGDAESRAGRLPCHPQADQSKRYHQCGVRVEAKTRGMQEFICNFIPKNEMILNGFAIKVTIRHILNFT